MHLTQKRIKRSITTIEKTNSCGSKKVPDPELETFIRCSHRVESTSLRESSKHQKLTIQKVCEKISQALEHFYSSDTSGFYTNCKDFLTGGIDSWKLKIVDTMNTYEYVGMSIMYKPYTDIESEIIKEWKKNYLLFAIMIYWYKGMRKTEFRSLEQFQVKYNRFRDFVSQISSLIFRSWLSNWEKKLEKKGVSALTKLYDQTSHFIITESSEFKKVYEKVILPLIQKQLLNKRINWKFDLSELKASNYVFDLEKQQNLIKSISALKKFARETRVSKKLELLKQFRLTLEMEIRTQQEALEEQSPEKGKKFEVIEKDNYIDAIIYCILKGEIHQIQHSMVYLTTLLGENLELLSKMQLCAYAVDFIAAVDFLTQKEFNLLSEEEEITISHLHNLAIEKRMKVVSTPQIEDHGFDDTILEKIDTKQKCLTYVEKEKDVLSI